jgi:hypothetical protein
MRAAEEATFKAVAELVEAAETVVEETVLKTVYMGLMPQITLAAVVVEALIQHPPVEGVLIVMPTVVQVSLSFVTALFRILAQAGIQLLRLGMLLVALRSLNLVVDLFILMGPETSYLLRIVLIGILGLGILLLICG